MPGPRKMSYTHEDCIDAILANPAVTQNALAARYGYTPTWISLVINSDAFQAALAKRRDEVISPELRATCEERFRSLISESQQRLLEKVVSPACPPSLALGVLTVASKAMGYGARDTKIEINQSFVVALPAAAASSEDWARSHAGPGGRAPVTLENESPPGVAVASPCPDVSPAGVAMPSPSSTAKGD